MLIRDSTGLCYGCALVDVVHKTLAVAAVLRTALFYHSGMVVVGALCLKHTEL